MKKVGVAFFFQPGKGGGGAFEGVDADDGVAGFGVPKEEGGVLCDRLGTNCPRC